MLPLSVFIRPTVYYNFMLLQFQLPVIKALAILKYCAASVNEDYGLNKDIGEAIKKAAEEVFTISFQSLIHAPIDRIFIGSKSALYVTN